MVLAAASVVLRARKAIRANPASKVSTIRNAGTVTRAVGANTMRLKMKKLKTTKFAMSKGRLLPLIACSNSTKLTWKPSSR